jgi:ankyrin repeat protein
MGLDDVIYYILAWTKDLEIKDVNGETALHHAVKNSIKAVHANVRAMKQMLIQGASRTARNNKGQTPFELIYADEQI